MPWGGYSTPLRPIATHPTPTLLAVYSEVWWTTAQDALPREIVDRFDNKVSAC